MILVIAATERELAGAGAGGAATLACGIGPVEAALRTADAIAETSPTAIVHVGIAGSTTLEPPALVLGAEAVYCDLADLAARLPRVDRVAADAGLLAAAGRALPEAHVLPIGTCARVGGGSACDVEAMEGFGVLRAAQLAGVPAVELRAVSNHPGEPDRARWRFEDAFAALDDALARVVAEVGP